MDVIYTLKNYKSPGHDHILNEDITAGIQEETEDDTTTPEQKAMLLKFIFKILSDFWYNECTPHDFKRTILRPFLKDSEESPNDPSN